MLKVFRYTVFIQLKCRRFGFFYHQASPWWEFLIYSLPCIKSNTIKIHHMCLIHYFLSHFPMQRAKSQNQDTSVAWTETISLTHLTIEHVSKVIYMQTGFESFETKLGESLHQQNFTPSQERRPNTKILHQYKSHSTEWVQGHYIYKYTWKLTDNYVLSLNKVSCILSNYTF